MIIKNTLDSLKKGGVKKSWCFLKIPLYENVVYANRAGL